MIVGNQESFFIGLEEGKVIFMKIESWGNFFIEFVVDKKMKFIGSENSISPDTNNKLNKQIEIIKKITS